MTHSVRSTYVTGMVSTASPARLLVLLYERLLLDLRRAAEAQRDGGHEEASRHLLHAQDIVSELRSTLHEDGWEGAAGLAALYDWLLVQLVQANVNRDVTLTDGCLPVVEPLAQAWREAATAPVVTPALA